MFDHDGGDAFERRSSYLSPEPITKSKPYDHWFLQSIWDILYRRLIRFLSNFVPSTDARRQVQRPHRGFDASGSP